MSPNLLWAPVVHVGGARDGRTAGWALFKQPLSTLHPLAWMLSRGDMGPWVLWRPVDGRPIRDLHHEGLLLGVYPSRVQGEDAATQYAEMRLRELGGTVTPQARSPAGDSR